MDAQYLKSLEEPVLAVSHRAGAAILAIYEQDDFEIIQKADKSPVTAADFAAHEVICEGLSALSDVYPILSEEVKVDSSERLAWSTYWLVDPLDGTKEFIRRNGEFGVNIALIHNNEPVLGVVFAPVLQKTYVGSKQNGAWKTKKGKVKPLCTSQASSPKRITFSRNHKTYSSKMQNYLDTLGKTEVVRMGSSLKSCLVAEGRADLYPRMGPTGEWDTAACQIIVEEAGGVLCDFNGQPLRYNTKDSLINPEFIVFGDKDVDWLQDIDNA